MYEKFLKFSMVHRKIACIEGLAVNSAKCENDKIELPLFTTKINTFTTEIDK